MKHNAVFEFNHDNLIKAHLLDDVEMITEFEFYNKIYKILNNNDTIILKVNHIINNKLFTKTIVLNKKFSNFKEFEDYFDKILYTI